MFCGSLVFQLEICPVLGGACASLCSHCRSVLCILGQFSEACISAAKYVHDFSRSCGDFVSQIILTENKMKRGEKMLERVPKL